MQRINLKNAVFIKDVSIKSKKVKMAVSFFVLNIILTLIFTMILMISNSSMANMDHMDIQAFTWIFDGFIIIICAMMCIMVPMETGPSISNERERQTLDVLLTTNMSPFEIILGKYFSSVAYMLLCIISFMPFLSVVLIYGGISLLQLFGVVLSVVATVLYLSAFGIFFSSMIRKSSRSSAISLAVVFLLVLGSIIFCAIVRVISELAGSSIINLYGTPTIRPYNIFSSGDWSLLLLYLNPASTVYDVLDKVVGINLFEYSLHGMSGVIETTSAALNPNNFFIKHWAPVGFVIQAIVSFLLLRFSASKLYATKRLNKNGKKKNH